MEILKLPYLVMIVIPRLGRSKGKRLNKAQRRKAIVTALQALRALFGGATTMRSQGVTKMSDGTVLLDTGQTLVMSGTTRRKFLRRRKEVGRIAMRVGKMINQESMAVIAYPSDGFIVILEPC